MSPLPSTRARGGAVRIDERGEGPAIVLFGGLGCAATLWHDVRSRLEDFTTLVVDPPGVGDAPTTPIGWTLADTADAVASRLHDRGIERVAAVGYSWGASLALELALRHRSLVDRLAMVSGSAGLGAVPGHPLSLVVHGHELARSGHWSWRGVAGQSFAYLTSSRWAALPGVPQPTLVLSGARDLVVPAVNSVALASLVPLATLRLLPDVGHELLTSHPAVVAHELRTFLHR